MSLHRPTASQAALVVMLETQLGERRGPRITEAQAARIFGEAYMAEKSYREAWIERLRGVLEETPARPGALGRIDLEAA